MEVTRKRLLSEPKPKHIQQKTVLSVHKVLKERRLRGAQVFVNAEAKAPERQSNSTRKIESVENKPVDSAVLRKRRFMDNVQDRAAPAQQKPRGKLDLMQKPAFDGKPATLADSDGRLTETRNRKEKNINSENCFKSTEQADRKKAKTRNQQEERVEAEICSKNKEKDEEKKRVLHDWKKIKIEKERQKQREAARLAVHQVNDTCGFEDNMQSMRDFEKLLACTGNAFVLTVNNYCFRV